MKTLTIKQPWAHFIVTGPKRVENRSRAPTYRGPLLIHAGKGMDALDMTLPDGIELPAPKSLPRGAIVGRAMLADVLTLAEARLRLPAADQPWLCGPFCWLLTDVVAFAEPIRCSGSLSFWIPETRILTAAKEARCVPVV